MNVLSHRMRIVRAEVVIALILVLLSSCLALFAWLEGWVLNIRHRASFAQTHFVVGPTPQEAAAEIAEEERDKKINAGGPFYKPLRMLVEHPGVERPKLYRPEDIDLPASTPVVGVEVNGTACAFVLAEMEHSSRHIVNLMLNRTPISVTYCDLADCVRVLSDDSPSPIPLCVGGLDVDQQMVLLLKGVRYGQESKDLPLADYPFKRTTFEQWRCEHPETWVYVGG